MTQYHIYKLAPQPVNLKQSNGLEALIESLDLLTDVDEFLVLTCTGEAQALATEFAYRANVIDDATELATQCLDAQHADGQSTHSGLFSVDSEQRTLLVKVEPLEKHMCFIYLLQQKHAGNDNRRSLWSMDYASQLFKALYFENLHVSQFRDREEISSLINLGRMVPSITHEINNPLGVGLTSVSHLKTCLSEISQGFARGELTEQSFTDFIEECNEVADLLEYNIDRAVGLVRDFKSNSVNQSSDALTHFNLSKHIHSIINSVKPALKSKQITFCTELNIDPDLIVQSYPGALFQVLTNLLFNSLNHAFDDVPDKRLTLSVVYQDASISLVIEDNGIGISETLLPKIFDPYFTTKKQRGGSGLGLSVVKSLVEEKLKGSLDIDSEVGRGTRFHIVLPLP